MIRISAPLVSSVVAKLCLSVCAWISLSIPAFSPYCFTIFVMKNLVRRTPLSLSVEEAIFAIEKLCLMKRGLN